MPDIYNMVDTWNAGATTFTAIKMNVTDTASAAASLLMDLQVGGTSRFSAQKNGVTAIAGDTVTTSQPVLNISQTWNAAGVAFTGIRANFTVTASNNGGLFLDLQRGGSSLFSVNEYGNVNSNGSILLPLRIGLGATSGLLSVASTYTVGWSSGTNVLICDTSFVRTAAAIIGVRGASSSAGGALSFIEQTAPSAPAADGCYIYAQDNGGGKTQLMALFSSGAAQQLAIQP